MRSPVISGASALLAILPLAWAAGSASAREGLDLSSADTGEPFSIRSDELEVTESESGGRQLTFRGHVEARRGDLLLRAGSLVARYTSGQKDPSSLRARGSVLVREGDREGRCREADYSRSEQKIYCRGDAVLRDGEDEVRGEVIVFDLASRRVDVEGGTQVALAPRADERERRRAGRRGEEAEGGLLGGLATDGPVRIEASELEAVEEEGGARRLHFDGSVTVAQEDLTLRAREIDAFYPPSAREPERLVARGDVVVLQEDREARCNEAVYRREARRVDCSGDASLRDGEDRVTGREISFDLEAEKLVITGDTRLVLAPRKREETATP